MRYYGLWSPGTQGEGPGLLLALGAGEAERAAPEWCVSARRHTESERSLAGALLRRKEYRSFVPEAAPLVFEMLIEDVEMRYLMGTRPPAGLDGTRPPYLEICALGLGSESGEGWSLEVLEFVNRGGDRLAAGFYDGDLPVVERERLAKLFDYPLEAEDPGGVLIVQQGEDAPTMVLEERDGARFRALRDETVGSVNGTD